MEKSKIVSVLRRLWLMSKERNDVINSAKVSPGRFKCSGCNNIFKRNEVEVHHILNVSKMSGDWDWDIFINNLFNNKCCVMCKSCHLKETKKERQPK